MSKFPVITNIDQILTAISGADEFIVKRDEVNGLLFVNYSFSAPTTFPDPLSFENETDILNAKLRRECRGIEFDLESGDLVTRKYHKFFNVAERAETQPDKIDWTAEHWILEKLDGSMITPYLRNGQIQYHTKMGFTDVAQPVNHFVKESPALYVDFCEMIMEAGCTPIFEWCSRQQRIVIDYAKEQLVLTAVRDNKTGEYLPYLGMCEVAAKYSIPVVHAWPGSVGNIHEFLEATRKMEGNEGCVLRFADGSHYKIKNEWYCLIHGTKDALSSEKNVWAMILEEKVDDAKPFMDDDDRRAVDAFVQEFGTAAERTAERLRASVEAYRQQCENKKAFALSIKDAVPSVDRGMMFSIWDGAEPLEVVLKVLKNNIGTGTRIDGVRDLVGGIRWDRFYKSANLED